MNNKEREEFEGYISLLGFSILHIFKNGDYLCKDEDNVLHLIDGDKMVTFKFIYDSFNKKNDKIEINCSYYDSDFDSIDH